MPLLGQLKHRRVFRAVAGYGIVAFALLQVIEPVMHGLHLPDATLTWFVVALGIAFPVVIGISWALEVMGGATEPPSAAEPGWALPQRPVTLVIGGLAIAALAVVLTLLAARRSPQPVPHPTLTQVTFEGGIEEYPAWSPDGKQLIYVAQSGAARKLFRKDLPSGSPVQITAGGADDLQPAWSPDGARVLFLRAHDPAQKLQPGDVFGMFVDGDVWQLDPRSAKETRLIENAFNPSFSPDGTRIAVDASWAGPRRIWVLDREGHNPQQVTTDKSEEVAHVAPRWSPDGKKIVFQSIERTKFDVRVVDLESKGQINITDDVPQDIRPVWSPSGRFIYFSSDRGGGMNIWRAPVQADGTLAAPLQQVTTGAGQDVEPAIAPDGRQLAFATMRQNADLWRLPVSPESGMPSGAPEALISTTREDSRGAWSPDGSEIAFNSDRGGEMNIWVHSLKDGKARQLTSGPGGDFQPNWSPDAKRIAFFSSRKGAPGIFVVDVAKRTLTSLSAGGAIDVGPFFSPDGKRIAFQSDRSGRSEVWVMHADGSGARQLTTTGASGHFIRWTGSGEAVVYRCPCGGKQAILAAPLSGGEPARLADINGGAHISFSPDRSRIMDVLAHRVLWVSPLQGGAPAKVFEFPDPTARIDYPVWSPDGRWVLFDRQHPEGGDVWVMRDFE